MSKDTVNGALRDFTEETDIPAVIVVDTMESAFGKSMPVGDILILALLAVVAAICIFVIIKKVVLRVRFEKNIQTYNPVSPYDVNSSDDE